MTCITSVMKGDLHIWTSWSCWVGTPINSRRTRVITQDQPFCLVFSFTVAGNFPDGDWKGSNCSHHPGFPLPHCQHLLADLVITQSLGQVAAAGPALPDLLWDVWFYGYRLHRWELPFPKLSPVAWKTTMFPFYKQRMPRADRGNFSCFSGSPMKIKAKNYQGRFQQICIVVINEIQRFPGVSSRNSLKGIDWDMLDETRTGQWQTCFYCSLLEFDFARICCHALSCFCFHSLFCSFK